jgi:hypothetical protein
MPKVLTRQSADRRRFVSPWFKRQIASRIVLTGIIVLGAVCLAFGAVGVGIGVGALAGIVVLVLSVRRRRWEESGRIPDKPDVYPR